MTGLPADVEVLVVGAGFGGIAAAHRLRAAGHEVLVVDKADGPGGTWRWNTYPGCACDVQSHLYSLSFAPNPGWTHVYSGQPEILAYLEDVVDRFGLRPLMRFGVEVTSARWDDGQARWVVATGAGTVGARHLVAAGGLLHEPRVPDVPGLAGFTGVVQHSTRWRDDVPLQGKDVVVVGTGASAVQLVPRLALQARRLTVLQRTPGWVLPRTDRRISPARRRAFAAVPGLRRAYRGWEFAAREALVPGLVAAPAIMKVTEALARAHLRHQVRDPRVRARLTPHFRAGCKRLLLSNDYLPAFNRENVELVPAALAAVDGDQVVAADGSRRRADVVVLATGFETDHLPIADRLYGGDGRSLAEHWRTTGQQALRGTAVHGFPNLFLLLGPNTALGHSSAVLMTESQLDLVASVLDLARRGGAATVQPTARAQAAWNQRLQRRMPRTVWASGGCSSWYQDEHGRITTMWPGSTSAFRRATRRADPAEFTLAGAGSVTVPVA